MVAVWGLEKEVICGVKVLCQVIDDAEDRVEGGRAVRFVGVNTMHGRNDYEVRLDIINKQQISCGCIRTSGKNNLVNLMDKVNRESAFYLVDVLYEDKV